MHRPVTFVLAGSIVLAQLPVLLGHQAIVSGLTLAAVLLCIGWGIPRHHSLGGPLLWTLSVLFVAVQGVALLRGAAAGASGSTTHAVQVTALYASLLGLAALGVSASRDEDERRERLIAIALAPAVYALANAIVYLMGIQPLTAPEEGLATRQPASILQPLHIYTHRVQFPFSTGVNNTGIMAGAGLAACLLLRRRVPGWILWPLTAGCVFCLLWSDSRMPLALAVLAGAYFGIFKRLHGARLIAIAVPLLPILMALAGSLLAGTLSPYLSRSNGGGGFATLGNRLFVWEGARPFVDHLGLDQLVGWGTNGNVTSGASLHYAYLFSHLPHPAEYSTHNVAIQTVLETGFIGLALLATLSYLVASRLMVAVRDEGGRPTVYAAMMGSMTVLLLGGATEAAPTSGTTEVTGMLLMLCGGCAALPALARVMAAEDAEEAEPERAIRAVPRPGPRLPPEVGAGAGGLLGWRDRPQPVRARTAPAAMLRRGEADGTPGPIPAPRLDL